VKSAPVRLERGFFDISQDTRGYVYIELVLLVLMY
jgi:hypothetical protein